LQTTTIITITLGTVLTGFLGYAIYFDHRRRTDPEFRKTLKKESKKQARAAKEARDEEKNRQRKLIREMVEGVNREGLPKEAEEVEGVFMECVAEGERLCGDESQQLEAALCFFRALKVYPNSEELISIYDKTVPKPILDILAEMIAYDPQMSIRSESNRSSRPSAAAAQFEGDI